MMEVRSLQAGEDWHVVALAQAMHGESPHYSIYPFDGDVLASWARLCRENDDWLCLVAWEDGRAIGFVAVGAVPMLFSREKTVDDLALFVLPERRGTTAALRLLRSMEPWAKSRAREIRMGVTTGTNHDQAVRFFQRFGYKQTGVLLTKRFET